MEIYLNLLSNKTAMISRNLDHQKKTYTHALFLRVSEWLLFNANAAMFKLYHGEKAISWREQVNFQRDDDEVFVLDQQAYFVF